MKARRAPENEIFVTCARNIAPPEKISHFLLESLTPSELYAALGLCQRPRFSTSAQRRPIPHYVCKKLVNFSGSPLASEQRYLLRNALWSPLSPKPQVDALAFSHKVPLRRHLYPCPPGSPESAPPRKTPKALPPATCEGGRQEGRKGSLHSLERITWWWRCRQQPRSSLQQTWRTCQR